MLTNPDKAQLVDQSAFDAALAVTALGCDTPTSGLFGSDSMSWFIDREAAIFLGGGCAALLQLAHPYVAHAVDQHSNTKTDPIGRFNRTFQNVHAMIFGDLQSAISSARRVRSIHNQIYGTITEDVGRFEAGHRYLANDADALFWVHATLIHTAVNVYERAVRPLNTPQKEMYWQESKHFAHLFGVPDSVLPDTWHDFLHYWHNMIHSDTLAVGAPARDIAGFLLSSQNLLMKPAASWGRVITAGLMPTKIRDGFGLRYDSRDQFIFETSWKLFRPIYNALPRRLRDMPAYVEARRRLVGDPRPDRIGRAVERMILQAIKPPSS